MYWPSKADLHFSETLLAGKSSTSPPPLPILRLHLPWLKLTLRWQFKVRQKLPGFSWHFTRLDCRPSSPEWLEWISFKCRLRHRFALFQLRWFLVTLTKPNVFFFSFPRPVSVSGGLFETEKKFALLQKPGARVCACVCCCSGVLLSVRLDSLSCSAHLSISCGTKCQVIKMQTSVALLRPQHGIYRIRLFSQSPDWHIFVAADFFFLSAHSYFTLS